MKELYKKVDEFYRKKKFEKAKEKWVKFLVNGVTFDLLYYEIHEWIVMKYKVLVEMIYKNITYGNISNI